MNNNKGVIGNDETIIDITVSSYGDRPSFRITSRNVGHCIVHIFQDSLSCEEESSAPLFCINVEVIESPYKSTSIEILELVGLLEDQYRLNRDDIHLFLASKIIIDTKYDDIDRNEAAAIWKKILNQFVEENRVSGLIFKE